MALVGFNPQFHTGAATLYLKVEPRRPYDELHAEAERLRWLPGRLPVPALCYTGADDLHSYQLTVAVPGVDATDDGLRAEPAQLVKVLAERLRRIHGQSIAGCPFDQRLDAELARATANVVIEGWALSGFIDLGRCGVADRYHDLAQAERSVRRNLGARWVGPFFAAYGIGTPNAVKLHYYQLLDELF